MGCSPWGRKELGTTERLTLTLLTYDSVSSTVKCDCCHILRAAFVEDK